MRHSIPIALIAAMLWAILPVLTLADAGTPAWAASEAAPAGSAPAEEAAGRSFDRSWRLPVLRDGQVQRMDLHQYLTGVLLAELPASFAPETFKAQAVASRTYALRSCDHRRHPDAAVCTDSGCCQGWRDPAQASPAHRARAEAALDATDGLVIRCGGQLIEATFFSCSGGQTESAAAVWGNELPYLQAVESPGEEAAAHYRDELRLSLEEFRSVLTELDGASDFSGDPTGWVGSIRRSAGGGVEQIELGGRPFTGVGLRRAFGLRSTAFSLELTSTEAVFTTRGYGHRVGMSQYGAEAMAKAGNDFETILKWYYTGVEIGPAEPGPEASSRSPTGSGCAVLFRLFPGSAP